MASRYDSTLTATNFLKKDKNYYGILADHWPTIQMEISKNDPKLADKPEAALAKIVEGKVNKTLKEICLVDQPFVKDPGVTVGQYTKDNGCAVAKFVRFAVGEGMQKREDNFVEEVMSQLNK